MRFALSWCAVVAGLSLTACSQFQDASPEEAALAGNILNARRAASLHGWEHKTMRGEPVLAYSLMRTAIVLPPGVKMTHHTTKSGDGILFEAGFSGRKKGLFTASAAAVTSDGYFLTAAHCLEEGACTLIVITRSGKLQVAPGRVVWNGFRERNGPDIGVVHAAVVPAGTIPFATFMAQRKGTRIFTSGFGARGPGGSGGRIIVSGNFQERPSGARWHEVFHDAPMAPGDSGGPILDEQGRLLGINTQIRGQWDRTQKSVALKEYNGVSVCPDAAWIQQLIANDRTGYRPAGSGAGT